MCCPQPNLSASTCREPSISRWRLRPDTTAQIQKDHPVIVYSTDYQCDLSARAAWRFESMGYLEVYRYTAGKADWVAAGFPLEGENSRKATLKNIFKTAVLTCGPRDRLGPVKNRRPSANEICVVVNDRHVVLGLIQGAAWDADPLKMASEVMAPAPRTYRPNRDPEEVMREMKDSNLEYALVTTSDGELLGFVQRRETRKSTRPRSAA